MDIVPKRIIIPEKTKDKIDSAISNKFKNYNGPIEKLVKLLFIEMAKLSIHDEINGIQYKVSSLQISDETIYVIDYQVGHFRSTKWEVGANLLNALGIGAVAATGLSIDWNSKLSSGNLSTIVSAISIFGIRGIWNILSDLRYTKFSYVYAPHLKKVVPNIHNFSGTTKLTQFEDYNKHASLKALEFAINKAKPIIMKSNDQDKIDAAIFGSFGMTLQKGIGNNISIASVIETKTNTTVITFKISYVESNILLLFKTTDPSNVAKGLVFINRDTGEVVWKI